MRYIKRIRKRISDKLERLMKENLRKAICGRFSAFAAAHGSAETDCAQISGEVTLNCVALLLHKSVRRGGAGDCAWDLRQLKDCITKTLNPGLFFFVHNVKTLKT